MRISRGHAAVAKEINTYHFFHCIVQASRQSVCEAKGGATRGTASPTWGRRGRPPSGCIYDKSSLTSLSLPQIRRPTTSIRPHTAKEERGEKNRQWRQFVEDGRRWGGGCRMGSCGRRSAARTQARSWTRRVGPGGAHGCRGAVTETEVGGRGRGGNRECLPARARRALSEASNFDKLLDWDVLSSSTIRFS